VADTFSRRQYIIRSLFVLAAFGLIYRAFQLQILDSTYKENPDATAIDEQVIYPARGTIYDRDGEILVYNVPMYDLMVTYNQLNEDMDTAAFCELLGIERPYFEEALDKDWRDPRYSKSVPFPFLTQLSATQFAALEERLYQFPGFSPRLRHARGYPHDNACHVLGYIREADQNDIKLSNGKYEPRDYLGKSGLELSYEDTLRGEKGISLILKDNLGREVGPYKDGKLDVDAVFGKDLITTIDLDLQAYGELLMENKIGAVVALEPATGEVLAMISSPNYNPNLLAIGHGKGNPYGRLSIDKTQPLFDRSIMGQYPPGSLFKTIVALVGMQEGYLDPNRTISCSGAYYFNGMRLTGCHGHPTCLNVEMGIQHSCNAYFVTAFREIVDGPGGFRNPEKGLDLFNSYLDKFGLGKPLGVDLPREQSGFYPTTQFYTDYFNKQQQGQRWNSVWIRSLGIGQGELQMTNLQMANVAATIANRGFYVTPHLVRGYRGAGVDVPIPDRFTKRNYVGIDSAYFEIIANGMEKVTISGTARMAYIPDIPVCGKTGTAENPHGEDHSVFFAFAPKKDPKIAIVVYVENSGFGGTYAAPIASLMIEKYMTDSISDNRKWLEKRMLDANLLPELP
jgi:penicillin-binding protein 2